MKLVIFGLFVHASSGHGFSGGLPFDPPSTCTYSQNEINGVIDAMKNAAKQSSLPVPFRASYSQSTSSAVTTSCQQALHEIQDLAFKLSKDFEKLVSSDNRISIDEYNKLKAACENDKKRLEQQIENVKRTVTQETQLKFNRIESQMQELNKQLVTALNKLEEERKRHKDTKILLCIHEIWTNRIISAVKHFDELNDESQINFIIRSAYDGNATHAMNILKFVRNLDTIDLQGKAYEVLYNEMQVNGDLGGLSIWVFQYRVNEVMKTHKYASSCRETKTRFEALKRLLEKAANSIVNTTTTDKAAKIQLCIYEILAGRISSAVKHFYELKDDSQIGFIIRAAYDRDSKNAENVLKFSVRFYGATATAFEVVFDEMRVNNDLESPSILLFNFLVASPNAGFLIGCPVTLKYRLNCLRLEALGKLLQSSVNSVINKWAAQIRYGDYQQVTEFSKNQDEAFKFHLKKLVTEAYASKVENIDNLMEFTQNLAFFEQHALAHEAIFHEMKENNHLDNPLVLVLHYRVHREIHDLEELKKKPIRLELTHLSKEPMFTKSYSSAAVSTQRKYQDLKKHLEELVKKIVDAWSAKIRNGDYEQIIEFTKNQTDAMQFQLTRIVIAVYSDNEKFINNFFYSSPDWRRWITYKTNLKGFDILLNFTRSLVDIKLHADVYEKLFDIMKGNTELTSQRYIKLALKVKESMENPKFLNLNYEDKKRFHLLKEKFKKHAQDIVWSPQVYITQIGITQNKVKLYAVSEYKNDRRSLEIDLVQKGYYMNASQWILEPTDDGAHFFIKNVEYNEYMYAADDEDQKVFTWHGKPHNAHKWHIESKSNFLYENDFVYLKSVEKDKYLGQCNHERSPKYSFCLSKKSNNYFTILQTTTYW